MASFGLLSLSAHNLLEWTLWLGLLLLLFKIWKLYLKSRELERAHSVFPGPKPHWLLGNVLEFHDDGSDLDMLYRYGEQFPYSYSMWFGKLNASLIVCHPDYAKAILGRQDPKDDFGYRYIIEWIAVRQQLVHHTYRTYQPHMDRTVAIIFSKGYQQVYSGKGLVILSGQKWFQRRRLLTPGFHYDVLKPYVNVMTDCVTEMLDKFDKLVPDQKPVELFHFVSLMTLDTVMKCAFSHQSNCQNDSESAYINAVYELAYLVNHRSRFLPYHSDIIYYLSPHGFRFRRALKIAHEHTDKIIKQRKKSLKHEKELERIQQKRHLDFLDIILCAKDENGQGLSDKELRAEVDTFMFAGHDTTASAISFILYCMAKYPEHQKKCREEIQEVLGDRNTVEWEDLGKIPYTTMCIKECLRLYPPVPLIARQLSNPITFCDGRSLPKNTSIILNIYSMHRSSAVWEDPEVFDPQRFSPEYTSKRHSHGFMPFSAGARNCIGQNFAMNEMKVAVALFLQKFEVLPDPENEPLKICQFVLRSLNGIHVNLKRIKK